MQLKSNLVSMRSISAFYNAIKTACDQLGMIGDFLSSRDRLMYFTDGLRSEYRPLGQNLFMQSQLPNFDSILPLFLQHEQWLIGNSTITGSDQNLSHIDTEKVLIANYGQRGRGRG